ncbi:hypothetical protein BsWGS_02643 [Bradybaena similaris]
MSIQTPAKEPLLSRMKHEMKPSCPNVLDNMVVGRWVQDRPNQTEMAAVVEFNRIIQAVHGIPQTLQRKDKRCGNVNMVGTGKRGVIPFRALCDPNGSTPCCFENKCVFKDIEQCRCKGCYDLRQKLHAELSTWIPANQSCKITTFVGEEDACYVLSDLTIYFIGDSFMEQLYNALLTIVRRNKVYGPLRKETAEDIVKRCHRHHALTNPCLPYIDVSPNECNNTTLLRKTGQWKSAFINEILTHVKSLQRQRDSIVILGIGFHDNFDVSVIENKVLKPLLLILAETPWPKLIWLSTHSPGLMLSPNYRPRQSEHVVRYNLKVNDILRRRGISVLDFFEMTKSVMSVDGAHYGLALNDLKAQVLLNYILEMRTSA